jgi:hypothetical protein
MQAQWTGNFTISVAQLARRGPGIRSCFHASSLTVGTAPAALICLQIMSTCIALTQPFKDLLSALHVFSDPVEEPSATGDIHRLLRVLQGPASALLRIS